MHTATPVPPLCKHMHTTPVHFGFVVFTLTCPPAVFALEPPLTMVPHQSHDEGNMSS